MRLSKSPLRAANNMRNAARSTRNSTSSPTNLHKFTIAARAARVKSHRSLCDDKVVATSPGLAGISFRHQQ